MRGDVPACRSLTNVNLIGVSPWVVYGQSLQGIYRYLGRTKQRLETREVSWLAARLGKDFL